MTFDKTGLNEVISYFYALTKIRTVIFDDKFNKILAVPESNGSFCGKLKENDELKKKCADCDKNALRECLESGKLRIYTCHSGLTEAAAPIKMNGIILGYIMFGQIIDKSEKKERKEQILAYAKKYIDEDLSEAYSKLTTKSKKQIEAAANIMKICACYLWTNRLVKVNENCLSTLIAKYVSENLTGDLSAKALCEHFKISRNKLYKISKESYGAGIAEYVRKQRLSHAARMLAGDARVSEAAGCSGFDDYNYFSEVFKKEYGVLPSRYRLSENRR